MYVGGARDFWYEKSGAWVKNVGNHCYRRIVIIRSGSETSLVKIVHRLAFLLKFYLIIHQYFININAFISGHLSVFEFALIYLTLVRFTLKHRSARKLCVLACVNKS